MARVTTYLNFMGNTEEAFTLYQRAFGGELRGLMRFGDMPEGPGIGEDEEDKKLARARFKFYRDRGYEIRTHDLSK